MTDGPEPWARTPGPGLLELDLWVVPGGSRTGVTGVHDGRLRVAVAAPPEGGKANRAVQRLLAGLTGTSAGAVELQRGTTSRAKTWRVRCDDPTASLRRLREALRSTAPPQ
ncbi:MAG: DUF167 domain-containing protein [Acidimicrobiales bacterium]